MNIEDQIIQSIYDAIVEINQSLGAEQKLTAAPDTVLLGNGRLDSLQLLNLTLAVESNIEKRLKQSVSVIDAALLGDEMTPVTVSDLAVRIESQLNLPAPA
ncbi:MAG: hypothetical protein AB7H86_08235 [Blastocatellales bacterium]